MSVQINFVPSGMFNMLICCLVLVIGAGNVVCQETKTVRKSIGGDLAISTYKQIPEATEQCAPAECDWWKRFRESGNDLQQKGSEKSKRKFVMLFVEGLEKSYRVPLKDRPSQLLFGVPPSRPNPNLTKKSGKVVLSFEVMSDGSVGEIKVVESLRSDLDRSCIQATRQNIFLPAVKNGVFVAEQQNLKCGFGKDY